MSSPLRTRFQIAGEAAPSPQSLSSPSTSSTRSLPSSSSRLKQREEESSFLLHRLLQTSQELVAEQMFYYILWDVRESPFKAQYVENLGIQLSAETLNEFATTPPLPLVKIICEFPAPWECFVVAGKRQLGGAGTRNTVPVYPPVASASPLAHGRSSSASLAQTRFSFTPPPRPKLPPIPLPSTSSPLLTATPANVATVAPAPAPAPATVAPAPAPAPAPVQVQKSREIGVTIGDLLNAIYDHLHQHGVRSAELESLSDKQRIRVEEACDKRHRASFTPETAARPSMSALSPTSPVAVSPVSQAPSTSSSVTNAISSGPPVQGMKQVDKLMRHTWFAGLTVVPAEENTIRLTLKTPSATD